MEQYAGDFQLLFACILILVYVLWERLFPE